MIAQKGEPSPTHDLWVVPNWLNSGHPFPSQITYQHCVLLRHFWALMFMLIISLVPHSPQTIFLLPCANLLHIFQFLLSYTSIVNGQSVLVISMGPILFPVTSWGEHHQSQMQQRLEIILWQMTGLAQELTMEIRTYSEKDKLTVALFKRLNTINTISRWVFS